jgi:hypothetical protein
MTQFHVCRRGRELQLYAPRSTWTRASRPSRSPSRTRFAIDLAKQVGLYRTLGWAESADKALQEGPPRRGRVPLRLERAFEDREKLIFKTWSTTTGTSSWP